MKKILTKKAFTLPEAIVAAAVLAIAVVVIMQAFPASIRSSSLSRRTTVAVNLAQSALETTTAEAFNDIASLGRRRVSDNPSSSFYDYYQEVNVSFVDSNMQNTLTDTGIKKITATISWQEEGQEKSVSLPTLISRK